MILVADSGSGKTDWCAIDARGNAEYFKTAGLNPALQSADVIYVGLQTQLCPQIHCPIEQVFYYGAGVTPARRPEMEDVLRQTFSLAEVVEARSDLFGSARSVCGEKAGIACILGTGSNSCLFDGAEIIDAVNCGGYVLGDEGSGAVLGRNLLNAFMKRELSPEICNALVQTHHLSYEYIVEQVYRSSKPNVWLASFAKFMNDNRNAPCIHAIITTSFAEFFAKNVVKYKNCKQYTVHFTGSVAYYFRDILQDVAQQYDLTVGNIIQSPITGLAKFHSPQKCRK
jgi:N-acetylglucosamine kinase-like BadF-type ATPase